MKTIYQNFEEIADDFKNGDFLSHQLSDHSTEICELWQTSILEFARALDNVGIKLPEDPEIYERFWDNIEKCLVKWRAGLNRRKPFSKCLGKLTLKEAKTRYGFKGKVGHKLIIPTYGFGEISEDYYLIVRN